MDASKPTLAIFPAPSAVGEQLARRAHALGEQHGFEVWTAGPDWTVDQYFFAAFAASAVILDASLDDPARDDAFQRVIVLPSFLDHVLIVGRTPLPLNFVPVRQGGAPPYPYPRMELAGLPSYDWGNEQILGWINEQFADPTLCTGPRLDEGDFQLLNDRGEAPRYQEMLREALRLREQRRSNRVFISYRGHDYEGVRRLVARNPNRPFRVIAPGELALERELLTEARRWMVLGLLDDALRDSSEVWVFNSSRYQRSWWTLGELVAVAYIEEPPEHRSPPVRVYDPERERFDDSRPLAVQLTADQRKRLSRRFSNTRPDTMGPEKLEGIRATRKMLSSPLAALFPLFGSKLLKMPQFEMMFKNLPPEAKSGGLREALQEFASDPVAMRAYFSDVVFSDEFWEELRVERAFVTGTETEYPLDAEHLLSAPSNMIAFSSTDVAAAVANGHPARSRDGRHAVHVIEGPPRYLWFPPVTGVAKPGLRPLPVYLVAEP